MGKMAMILLFSTIMVITTAPAAKGVTEGPDAVKTWFGTIPGRAQKTTNMDFYFHDLVSGKNPTAVPIVQPSSANPVAFGSTSQVDDMLTVGPDPKSAELGRAQGTYSITSLTEPILHMSLTIVFTSGEFNGSTLSVVGRNPVMHEYREMPILGGTGVFRLAQGIVTAKTVTANALGDAVVHWGVSVRHYSDGDGGSTGGATSGPTSGGATNGGQEAAAAPAHVFATTITLLLLVVSFSLIL